MPNRTCACRICGDSAELPIFRVREMMYGTREEFDYFQCATCGCLQIDPIPDDLSRFYPGDYYSYAFPGELEIRWKGPFFTTHMRGSRLLQRLACMLPGRSWKPLWLERAWVDRSAPVLEIGCGKGGRLLDVAWHGHERLVGIDPYVPRDHTYRNGVQILSRTLREVTETFGLVMMHHSFEHIPEPLETLATVRNLLRDDGKLLIRVPLASSWAWRHYGVDWVQLDAPRHLFLHTPESMAVLAKKAGFRIADTFYDSDEFQIWGSEQYAKGISLHAENSHARTQLRSMFSWRDIAAFRRKAEALNASGEGDSGGFVLVKSE
ncbi:MAG: class I SAM-dependent methyltransferase [Myxococcota bacterium]|nr:class I SAM-dependent methyltransferase [Myxococcota bacterium]